MIRLYNSLTKKLDTFVPIRKDSVGIYSCGPTVYDRAHIGNLSSYIYTDLLKRFLTVSNYTVSHVMNITDIDDKTIKRSKADYPDLPPKDALEKSTQGFEELFLEDMSKIGIDMKKIQLLRATKNIREMQKIIIELFDANIAYLADDGVYFSIKNYKQSGKQYGQLVEITAESTGAARVNNDEYDKSDIHDFALWKAKTDNEPYWDLEIDGRIISGRPGWHIECSAMSTSALGIPFDIHTGGVDLKFPHHENEIAQSTAGSERNHLAKYFVHNEHLLVDKKKMSKSLGNYYTLKDILAKGFDPIAFRVLVIQSHYRSQLHFSITSLEAAKNYLDTLRAIADLQFQPKYLRTNKKVSYKTFLSRQLACLSDDLNTPAAVSGLSAVVDEILSSTNT
jgi:cysteinyl-tRNA synthetase